MKPGRARRRVRGWGGLLSMAVILSASLAAFGEPGPLGRTVGGMTLPSALPSNLTNERLPSETAASKVERLDLELDSLHLTALDGDELAPESFKRKKVVLYFWSMYCRPCLPALEELEELRGELAKQNTELITIHLFEPRIERVVATAKRLGLTLPIFFAPANVRDLFSVRILPASLVFDADHRLVARFDGAFDKERLRLSLTTSSTTR